MSFSSLKYKMFLRTLFAIHATTRSFSSRCEKGIKVAVIGAAGGIGQPLCLLLKQCPLITQLNMQDIAKHLPGVAMDVSHVETIAKVKSFVGKDKIAEAIDGVQMIVVPAGMPRKPGMTRDDLFGSNATIVKDIADICSQCNPKANLLIITNPVNSVLPVASEIYKKNKTYNPCKIFGVTTLDITRANTFIGRMRNLNPSKISCPVICGHSGVTILPVISKCTPKVEFDISELEQLNKDIQNAGTEVVQAKAGMGSATLGMAYAGARFAISLARAMNGEDVIECTMVASDVCPAVDYFANPIKLGKDGVEVNCGMPKLNKFEEKLLEKAIPVLQKEIKKGVDFVKKSSSSC